MTVVSVYWADVDGNIAHMENGREPDAGVSVIGYIVVPIFFIGIAHLGNFVLGELGWLVIYAFFVAFVIYTILSLPRQVKKYKELLRERTKS